MPTDKTVDPQQLRWSVRNTLSLSQLGFLLWAGCLILTLVSSQFRYGVPALSRPILPLVGLLLAMSAIYLLAIWKAIHSESMQQNWPTILVFALAMRLVMVFSTPIQELDYYRYLWDGESVLVGVSPYKYSPQQVLCASTESARGAHELGRLVELCESNPRAAAIASRVHYGELPSIYPPVSLAVFAVSVATTPASASVDTAVMVLKWWIVLFDVGIIFLLRSLLIAARFSVDWTVAYAWCPLTMKEFANSGHLDAIAVFFMLGAVVILTRVAFTTHDHLNQHHSQNRPDG